MQEVEDRPKSEEKMAELKRQIAGIKQALEEIPPEKMGKKVFSIKQIEQQANWVEAGIKTRFQPGHSGNPNGPGKVKVVFWRFVCQWLNTLLLDIKQVDEDDLTLSQIGALKFAKAVGEGKWLQTKEVIDRELGRVGEAMGDDDKPKVIRYPLKMPFGENDESSSTSETITECNKQIAKT